MSANMTPPERDAWISLFAAHLGVNGANGRPGSILDAAEAANFACAALMSLQVLRDDGHPALDAGAMDDIDEIFGITPDLVKISGERLEYARRMSGLSLRQAASRIGVTTLDLHSYEFGEPEIERSTLRAATETYNVDDAYLMALGAPVDLPSFRTAQSRAARSHSAK